MIFLTVLFIVSALLGKNINRPSLHTQKELSKTPKQTALAAKQNCNNTDDSKFRDKFDCYSDVFYILTQKNGAEFAFETVDELKKIDTAVKSSCHPIGHAIGWGVYDLEPKTWKDAIKKMSSACAYGVHMGMIERYASVNGGELDKKTVSSICDTSGGCNHGIGHVALLVTDNDIEKALDLCSVLPKSYDRRHWCYTGVFMETRTMQNLAEHITVSDERLTGWALFLDDYIKDCSLYQDEVYVACWSGLALPAIINFNDGPKIFEICNSAITHEASNKCRREAVNYLVERNFDDLSAQGYLCDMAPIYDPEFAHDCHGQISYNSILLLEPNKFGTVVSYCNNISEEHKAHCFDNIHNGLSSLRNPVNPETVCLNTQPEYRKICLGEKNS